MTTGVTGSFATPYIGTSKAVTLSGSPVGITGTGNQDYTVTQPSGLTATISNLVVNLTGTVTYNCGTIVQAGQLTIANNVDGANLTLSGQLQLPGKNAPSQTGFNYFTNAVARVQSSTTWSAGTNTSSTITNVLSTAPTAGNTLIAVISTRGTSASRISSIAGGASTWTRATQTTVSSGTTTEIWYGTNIVAGASTNVVITQAAALRAASVVIEYSGLLAATTLDKTNSAAGTNSSPLTGTTTTTTAANEVWIGGIGFTNSTYTLSSLR